MHTVQTWRLPGFSEIIRALDPLTDAAPDQVLRERDSRIRVKPSARPYVLLNHTGNVEVQVRPASLDTCMPVRRPVDEVPVTMTK